MLLSLWLLFVSAQTQPAPITGEWRGTSTCVNLTLAPACKDEVVRYIVSASPTGMHVGADKLVAGRYESMGDIDLVAAGGEWRFDFTPRGAAPVRWAFRLTGSTLSGTLTQVSDGALLRTVTAVHPKTTDDTGLRGVPFTSPAR